jgi:hypothetical protein
MIWLHGCAVHRSFNSDSGFLGQDLSEEAPVAERDTNSSRFAAMVGTDVATYARERPA